MNESAKAERQGTEKFKTMIKKKVMALHALNWYYGNICSRKCPLEKQREHYEKMREIIKGHEDFLITHKMFIEIMHQKHNICGLSDEEIYKVDKNFWKFDCKYHLW